jgi:hypothetical protein
MVTEKLEPDSGKPRSKSKSRSKSRSSRAMRSCHTRIKSNDKVSPSGEYDHVNSICAWSVKGIKRLKLDQYKPMSFPKVDVRIHI